ncbi:hypothetical protein GCM10010252_17680 [Streptomyces aureoverticillatus]|nr:hypothetical protein GCM10010252_17680 [Streptomyces aureoverticillatus]
MAAPAEAGKLVWRRGAGKGDRPARGMKERRAGAGAVRGALTVPVECACDTPDLMCLDVDDADNRIDDNRAQS